MPSKVVYYTASSLDGFIADEHHSLDWLFEVPHTEDDGGWDRFIGSVGAGAPLLPRRITSSRMSFREVTHVGQRLSVVLDVQRGERQT